MIQSRRTTNPVQMILSGMSMVTVKCFSGGGSDYKPLNSGRHAQAWSFNVAGQPKRQRSFARRRFSYGGQPSLPRRLVELAGIEPATS